MTTPNLMNATSIIPQTLVFNGISGATYLDGTLPIGNVASSYYTAEPSTTTGGIILYNPTGSNSVYKLNTGILDTFQTTFPGIAGGASDVGRITTNLDAYSGYRGISNFGNSNDITYVFATLEIARYNNGLIQYPIFKNQVSGCNILLHKDSSIYMMEGDFLIVSAVSGDGYGHYRVDYRFTLSYEIIS
jgi:hypothetical protein